MSDKNVVAYNYLEDQDVHEWIFAESSRRGMDEYIASIYDIYDDHLKGKPDVLILLDISQSGMLPIKYASLITEKTFNELSPFPKTYVAYLSSDLADKSLVNIMDYTATRKVNRLYFPLEDRDRAIEWLLSKRNGSV